MILVVVNKRLIKLNAVETGLETVPFKTSFL